MDPGLWLSSDQRRCDPLLHTKYSVVQLRLLWHSCSGPGSIVHRDYGDILPERSSFVLYLLLSSCVRFLTLAVTAPLEESRARAKRILETYVVKSRLGYQITLVYCLPLLVFCISPFLGALLVPRLEISLFIADQSRQQTPGTQEQGKKAFIYPDIFSCWLRERTNGPAYVVTVSFSRNTTTPYQLRSSPSPS